MFYPDTLNHDLLSFQNTAFGTLTRGERFIKDVFLRRGNLNPWSFHPFDRFSDFFTSIFFACDLDRDPLTCSNHNDLFANDDILKYR